jgi:conjugal transfer pilus assembly protein TrbC
MKNILNVLFIPFRYLTVKRINSDCFFKLVPCSVAPLATKCGFLGIRKKSYAKETINVLTYFIIRFLRGGQKLLLICVFSSSISFSAPEISLEGDTKAASLLLQELAEKKGNQERAAPQNISNHENYSNISKGHEEINSENIALPGIALERAISPPRLTQCHFQGNLESSCPQSQEKNCISCNLDKIAPSNSELIVFVSFSLGDATLKKLFQDVNKMGGRLVLRGLYKNSFRLTQERIRDLGIVVEIDPPLFDKFQIQQVPTFVLALPSQGETVPDHDVLKGNVSLSYALEQFVKEGSIKDSTILLKRLNGDQDV